jgi:hypothetical protein
MRKKKGKEREGGKEGRKEGRKERRKDEIRRSKCKGTKKGGRSYVTAL